MIFFKTNCSKELEFDSWYEQFFAKFYLPYSWTLHYDYIFLQTRGLIQKIKAILSPISIPRYCKWSYVYKQMFQISLIIRDEKSKVLQVWLYGGQMLNEIQGYFSLNIFFSIKNLYK
jgi:hypothetical protein